MVASLIRNAPDGLSGPPAISGGTKSFMQASLIALTHCNFAMLAITWGRNGPLCHRSIRPLRATIFLGVGTYPRSTLFPLPSGGVHAGRDLCPSVNRR